MARARLTFDLYHLDQVVALIAWAKRAGGVLRDLRDAPGDTWRHGTERIDEVADQWDRLLEDLTDPDAEPDEDRQGSPELDPPRTAADEANAGAAS